MRKTVFFVGSLVTVSVLLIPLSTSRRRGSRGTHDRRECLTQVTRTQPT